MRCTKWHLWVADGIASRSDTTYDLNTSLGFADHEAGRLWCGAPDVRAARHRVALGERGLRGIGHFRSTCCVHCVKRCSKLESGSSNRVSIDHSKQALSSCASLSWFELRAKYVLNVLEAFLSWISADLKLANAPIAHLAHVV